jgi:hypothetical protein
MVSVPERTSVLAQLIASTLQHQPQLAHQVLAALRASAEMSPAYARVPAETYRLLHAHTARPSRRGGRKQ